MRRELLYHCARRVVVHIGILNIASLAFDSEDRTFFVPDRSLDRMFFVPDRSLLSRSGEETAMRYVGSGFKPPAARFSTLQVTLLALLTCVLLASQAIIPTFNFNQAFAAAAPTLAADRPPQIHFAGVQNLSSVYNGPSTLTAALRQNAAPPLALAAADFDEDGVVDLICSYAGARNGLFTMQPGNVASIYPDAADSAARRERGEFAIAPFQSSAHVFDAPEAGDFVGAGDFNGDSHKDLVVAHRGSNQLFLLAGDGRGEFKTAKAIALPGEVTALTTGEINRRDGLEDIIVGIRATDGAKALVFEGERGALNSPPESIALPAPATSFALGQFDDCIFLDLAIAAGSHVVIVHGRDRKTYLDPARQAGIAQADLSSIALPFAIKGLAVGAFFGSPTPSLIGVSADGRMMQIAHSQSSAADEQTTAVEDWQSRALEIAASPQATTMVSASISTLPGDDLLLLAGNQVTCINTSTSASMPQPVAASALTLAAEPIAALPLRLNADAASDLVILVKGQASPQVALTAPVARMTVNSAFDTDARDNVLTLREAIRLANGSLAKAQLTDAEKAQVEGEPGSNQPDAIEFAIPGQGPFSIQLQSSLDRLFDTVTIDGYSQPGAARNTARDGDNAVLMIEIDGSKLATLPGGPDLRGFRLPGQKCVVSGLAVNRIPAHGFELGFSGSPGGHNIIEGNFIGTDVTGTQDRGNGGRGVGIEQDSSDNLIGGTAPQARNLISANTNVGLRVFGDGATGNRIEGNFIGTDATGKRALGNRNGGVLILDQSLNVIGGTDAGAGNVISGNDFNRDENGNIVGASAGLTIARPGAKMNLVQSNIIGADVTGTAALGNPSEGVLINEGASENTVGGSVAAARNILSGNNRQGIVVGSRNPPDGSEPPRLNNLIEGNFIGTDVTGTQRLGNGRTGVLIAEAGNPTLIRNNVISANGNGSVLGTGHGISLGGLFVDPADGVIFGGSGSEVSGNKIGTDVTGSKDLGNLLNGIYVENKTLDHKIRNNVIAFNKANGVCVPNNPGDTRIPSGEPGIKILIGENSIFSNAAIGIDLGDPGVNPLHQIPATNAEANRGQDYPVLMAAAGDASATTVEANFKGEPNKTYTIEVYRNPLGSTADCKARPQGKAFLRSFKITTDATGNRAFTVALPPMDGGGFVSATAIDVDNNTSEFSPCLQQGPRVLSVTVLSTITVVGSGFSKEVAVFIDGIGFNNPAVVRHDRRVVQKGKLTNGQSIEQAVPAGKTVKIKLRNSDGGETEVAFRR
jgi:FG-GAP-like repeat